MRIFRPEPKQQEFIDAVFSGLYKYLFFGGAIGGGKTYVGLATLIFLSKIFPGSKWCVIRRDDTKLRLSTLPTFYKVCPKRFLHKFVDNTAHFTNGSQIIFRGENFNYDKDLTWFDGFEVNGFLLEEVQELQEKTFKKSILRAGRNVLPSSPPILVLLTGNPSQNWSKGTFVDPYKKGELKAPFIFIPASMDDNSKLPQEYKEGLSNLDYNTYQRYVLGNWDIIDVDKPFAYAFKRQIHVDKLAPATRTLPIDLSFDFNIDPITCLVGQHQRNKYIRVLKEYRLSNSNIYELCKKVKADYPIEKYYYQVTGDATGRASNAMVKDNLNYYKIIMKEFRLKPEQMFVGNTNPSIINSRALTNSLLEKFPELIIDESCKYLIDDLEYCEVNNMGDIDKTKDKHRTHLLDCFRYLLNTFHRQFLKFNF